MSVTSILLENDHKTTTLYLPDPVKSSKVRVGQEKNIQNLVDIIQNTHIFIYSLFFTVLKKYSSQCNILNNFIIKAAPNVPLTAKFIIKTTTLSHIFIALTSFFRVDLCVFSQLFLKRNGNFVNDMFVHDSCVCSTCKLTTNLPKGKIINQNAVCICVL